jgi:predicted metalloprotease with PDZ domain
VLDRFKRLVAEEIALFGARHYRKYDFLLTMSDHTAHFGLEHHESSDDRVPERFLVDPDVFFMHGDLLAHEMTHSWNGKYRRPRGLQTNDYRQPIDSSLLWVYEGLTNYYGEILAARSGLWTPEQARDQIAWQAARLATQPGRDWRPIEDTGTAAQILYDSSKAWESARRTVDFYEEGTLIWLEADSLIREKTSGRKSLDDFARAFHGGGQDTAPEVKWYDAKDVYDAMNAVVPYDWKTFFEDRIVKVRPDAPFGGLERDGWRLSWTETKTPLLLAKQEVDDIADERFSLGLWLRKDALIEDVLPGSPAAKAGIAPSEMLLAVNGRKYERRVLETALQEAKGTKTPIELLTENGEFFQTFKVDWHGGERYPVLERIPGSPDRLADVTHPRAGA